MTIRIEDYDAALELFLEEVRKLGRDCVSVMLHGSMACKTVRPGASDIMDAHLVLRPELFADRDSYLRALEVMLEACEKLTDTGIPFHPFGYLGEDELDFVRAGAFSIFPFEPFARVVAGRDVLPEIASTPASEQLGATYFFEARHAAQFHLSRYVDRTELTAKECAQIVAVLTTVKKSLSMACLALGMRLDEIDKFEILDQLEEAVPGLDTSVVGRIARVGEYGEPVPGGEVIGRTGKVAITSTGLEHVEEILEVAAETREFLEDLHDGILRHARGERGEEARPAVVAAAGRASGGAD